VIDTSGAIRAADFRGAAACLAVEVAAIWGGRPADVVLAALLSTYGAKPINMDLK
jgi:hypothetical protein